jgi:carboxypeptidase Taq
MSAQQLYEQLCRHARETAILNATESVLGWDERTVMPAAGAEYRAEQMSLLSGMIHRRRTDPRLGEWLEQLVHGDLAVDPHSESATTIRQLKREYDKKVKVPQALVEELTRTTSLGQHVWLEAREKNQFALLRPFLEKIFRLKREQAAAVGYAECPYDALLDDFEPGELTSRVTRILAQLRDALVPLVAAIRASGRQPDATILTRRYPTDVQERFGSEAAAKLGFDFRRGRLDVTAHPFCTGLGPHDCRITTRYEERFFSTSFFGILHEAGHGIYDQGLPADSYGLPPGEAVSLGIHESQSRLWENLVGRSLPFWQYLYPAAQQAFAEALGSVRLEDFYFAINDVRPSLIRVEADEATYNLHILIRFELEQSLVSGDLAVADLPGAWNEKYRQYLGIESPNDTDGVLQDIHWSAGLVGYFPTYSLGNLYAAQFYVQADRDLGGLDRQHARGEYRPLGDWLRTQVHQHGQRFTAAELVHRVTGQPLSHLPLIEHLRSKFGSLYGLK